MKIALATVSVLFGGLSVLAALSQMRTGKPLGAHITMAAGGLLLIIASVCLLTGWQGKALNAALGCALICVAAVWNGKRSGNFHIQHHIIRVALSLVLVAGFILL